MTAKSLKRIASENEKAIRNLQIGMILSSVLAFVLRFLFRRNSLPPSASSLVLYTLGSLPAAFLSRYLQKIGSPRRDDLNGLLLSSGEDLSRPGVIDYCFDIIYVTWTCQVGSGALGEWFWWSYMIIPLYAIFKVFATFGPSIFKRQPTDEGQNQETLSKRQEKLRKRGERGDPRVQKIQTSRK